MYRVASTGGTEASALDQITGSVKWGQGVIRNNYLPQYVSQSFEELKKDILSKGKKVGLSVSYLDTNIAWSLIKLCTILLCQKSDRIKISGGHISLVDLKKN